MPTPPNTPAAGTEQEVRLYLAMSLDGCIARADGAVDWLEPFHTADYGPYAYEAFYAGVGSLVMGRLTYQQVVGFGPWPYPDKPAVVLTSDYILFPPPRPEVRFRHDTPAAVVEELRAAAAGHVWLVGGGQVATAFLAAGVVDRIILLIIPVLLGDGVRLFRETGPDARLHLESTQRFQNGVVAVEYRVERLTAEGEEPAPKGDAG